ncbi:hypothetical protein [Streptomyces sp. NPDC051132]
MAVRAVRGAGPLVRDGAGHPAQRAAEPDASRAGADRVCPAATPRKDIAQ